MYVLTAMIQKEEIAIVMMEHFTMMKKIFALTALSYVVLALKEEDSIVMSIVHGSMSSLYC